MKTSLPLVLFLLLGCIILPAAAQSVTASLSSGSGSPEIPPQDASAYINSTRAAMNERNWSGVLLLSAQGIAYYPDNADLICIQAYAYRKMGQYAHSVELVTHGIGLDPKPVRYANRGYGYLALGNYSAALADAGTGLALDPNFSTNYAVQALALQGMGRSAEAREAINRGIALEPANAHFWHVNGLILANAGDCAGAKAALERSISLDPDYSLPYPGFSGAREHLAGLNTSCVPTAAQTPVKPQPTKSPLGGIAVAGLTLAFCLFGIRK